MTERIKANFIIAGTLAAAGALSLLAGAIASDRARQKCKPITTTTPSGQAVTFCRNWGSNVEGSQDGFIVFVGGLAVIGAGVMVAGCAVRRPLL